MSLIPEREEDKNDMLKLIEYLGEKPLFKFIQAVGGLIAGIIWVGIPFAVFIWLIIHSITIKGQ